MSEVEQPINQQSVAECLRLIYKDGRTDNLEGFCFLTPRA